MRYDPIADFAYHLGYSYGEAEEMLIKHEKKSNEKEVKKIVEVEERADTKDNKNVFKNWLLEEAGLDDEELTLYYKGKYEGKQYEGYIIRQKRQVEQYRKMEKKMIPETLDYDEVPSLRLEARQKLKEFRPVSVGQASRISGVSPADISVLLVYLEHYKATK